jgi:hypothetical protein
MDDVGTIEPDDDQEPHKGPALTAGQHDDAESGCDQVAPELGRGRRGTRYHQDIPLRISSLGSYCVRVTLSAAIVETGNYRQ